MMIPEVKAYGVRAVPVVGKRVNAIITNDNIVTCSQSLDTAMIQVAPAVKYNFFDAVFQSFFRYSGTYCFSSICFSTIYFYF